MPVIDREVHEKVKINTNKPYGCHSCHNHPKPDGYVAMSGNYIVNRMSRECRYDKSLEDPRCSNCSQVGLGKEYWDTVVANAS